MTYWQGTPPSTCQIMGEPITDTFVDGALQGGSWGILCDKCHKTFGVGLGKGRGQKYTKQTNGKWLKTEG